jgi:hypothetical protein
MRRLCAHAFPELCPIYDHLLTQKLTIELAESELLNVANIHPSKHRPFGRTLEAFHRGLFAQ